MLSENTISEEKEYIARDDLALRELRRDLQKEKVFSILKLKRNYEKPSDKRTRKRKESRRKKRTYSY